MTDFIINPKVVSETVQGEAILIHLETGSYYSLTGAGAEIWGLIAARRSAAEITGELADRHGRPSAEVGTAVDDLLAELVREDLLHANGATAHPPASPEMAWRAPAWVPPKLEKYDDMQDFLLVDPIHDVDDVGWPKPAPGA
jgi:hypothetical protein